MNKKTNNKNKECNGVSPGPSGPDGTTEVAAWVLDLASGGGSDPQERGALAWAEGLSSADADVALDLALAEWPSAKVDHDESGGLVWDTSAEPEWCPTCGGAPWWDGGGRLHCEKCDPPNRSELVASRARHLYGTAQDLVRALPIRRDSAPTERNARPTDEPSLGEAPKTPTKPATYSD